MGALKPWHILALLCCLLVTAAVAGLIVWLSRRKR